MTAKKPIVVMTIMTILFQVSVFASEGCVNALSDGYAEEHEHLMRAVSERNFNRIRMSMVSGLDVDATDPNDYTALMLAANLGDLEVTKLLVNLGANVNAQDNQGYTPLMEAVLGRNLEVMEFLIGQEADISLTNNEGQTAMAIAEPVSVNEQIASFLTKNQSDTGSETLLSEVESEVVEATIPWHDAELVTAAKLGDLNKITQLIKLGADPDAADSAGLTALTYAVMTKSWKVVEFLIKSGANIQMLSPNHPILILAAAKGMLEAVRKLVELGAEVNATDHGSYTALMLTATTGDQDAVRLLIELGADIEAKTTIGQNRGLNSLMMAAVHGHLNVAKVLVDSGADMDAENQEGYTAVILAATKKKWEVVEFLIKSGADIDSVTSSGFNPLGLMISDSNIGAVLRLVNLGANVNAFTHLTYTPLMLAVVQGKRLDTLTLLNLRVDPNIQVAKTGWTALMYAAFYGYLDIADLLLSRGADPSLENSSGKTALSIAKDKEHKGIVELFKKYENMEKTSKGEKVWKRLFSQ